MSDGLKLFILFFILFIKCALASDSMEIALPEETLCMNDEDIYFSCPLENKKLVSVCARNNINPNRGYVSYRYGNKNAAFVYPRPNRPPDVKFVISDVSEGSIRGLHLKFANRDYTYVISSVWPGELYVSRNGRIVFDQQCQASSYKSFSNKIFDGLTQAPPSDVDLH